MHSSDHHTPPETGETQHPTSPLPAQHQDRPGQETKLDPPPQYQAEPYQGSGKLAGKVAIITGGDSGIGRAVAVLFAREGADVGIIYLNEHEDAKITKHAVQAEGQQCITIAGDVAQASFCQSAVQHIIDALGTPHILVNNAGYQHHAKSLLDISEEQWQRTFNTNITGYFNMAKVVVPHLNAGDAIINTSSVTAFRGSEELIDYSSTKGAIVSFTYSLASSLAKQGIRVNAVAPGPVWTPLNPADRDKDDIPDFGKHTVFGRPAQPEELAPAYVFLASPVCASYITGMVLPITGKPGY